MRHLTLSQTANKALASIFKVHLCYLTTPKQKEGELQMTKAVLNRRNYFSNFAVFLKGQL